MTTVPSTDAPPAVVRRPGWKRLTMRLLLLLLAGYALWLTLLYYKQDEMIYPGAFVQHTPLATARDAGGEEVWIETSPGVRVEGWFLPGEGRSAAHPGPVVLMAHGNFEFIDEQSYHAREFRKLGLSVLLPEYRGYGRSGGRPDEAGITADFVAFYDWLARRPEVDASRIVLFGQSIGGGAVSQLAARRTPAAVILQSTFSSMSSMAWKYLAPPALLKSPWRTDRVLPTLGRPVLILHGRQDSLIPIAHARRLHELTPSSELLEMDGGHNNFPMDLKAYWAAIREFLKKNGL